MYKVRLGWWSEYLGDIVMGIGTGIIPVIGWVLYLCFWDKEDLPEGTALNYKQNARITVGFVIGISLLVLIFVALGLGWFHQPQI